MADWGDLLNLIGMDFGGEGQFDVGDIGGDVPSGYYGPENATGGEFDVGDIGGDVPSGYYGEENVDALGGEVAPGSTATPQSSSSAFTRLLGLAGDALSKRLGGALSGAKSGASTAISLFNPPDVGTIAPLTVPRPQSLALPAAAAPTAFTPYNPESLPPGALERLLRGGMGGSAR